MSHKTHTVIEINGRDRPGFLYLVTRALYDLSLQISSAKISTFSTSGISWTPEGPTSIPVRMSPISAGTRARADAKTTATAEAKRTTESRRNASR